MRWSSLLLPALIIILCAQVGCTRTRYRTAADHDAYGIVREKSGFLTHRLPQNYSVRPDPRSRFYDPTNPDQPRLPVPRPILRGYDIPQLVSDEGCPPCTVPCLDVSSFENEMRYSKADRLPTIAARDGSVRAKIDDVSGEKSVEEDEKDAVVPAAYQPAGVSKLSAGSLVQQAVQTPSELPAPNSPRPGNMSGAMQINIPAKAWQVLPQSCIDRMLEFASLRNEYKTTFPDVSMDELMPSHRRLTLPNIMELTLINSREYQARKEVLYRTALSLTRQRYQFELNPTQFGNGTDANYRHLRVGGIEQNTLSVPTTAGVQKTLATGGQFLAQFANRVVLTFNGPQGFATDIGSEVVLDFQQALLQRDIRFEQLTQNERDVVYAARDYIRFRKQLFRDVAGQYYNLLVSFRGIEINSQDYFTNLRGFIQSQAEYRTAEKISRVQVDQFEQNVLRTRSNLVNNCFALEAALDQFKFRLGLPTEMTIHLDLSELEAISMKDELSVARQMINRARTELITNRDVSNADATTLANVAEVLADRMANILDIQARMDAAAAAELPEDKRPSTEAIARATRELKDLRHLLRVIGVRMQVQMLRKELDAQVRAETPAPALRVLIRAADLGQAELQVIDLALSGAEWNDKPVQKAELIRRREVASRKLGMILSFMEELSENLGAKVDVSSAELLDRIPGQMQDSVELTETIRKLADDATQDILPETGQSMEARAMAIVDQTIKLSDRLLEKGPDGWEEIVLDQDEALLTALVQRLDLMNQRGDLADAWRQIKLAGDDLRSILNLQATQVIRTDSKKNNAFDFTLDDSETRVGVTLDTPLNRRSQRNNFRTALINYNVGLRNLMAAEDSIKLDVREDLRQLALDRNQYTIAVASAALANERVISTRMRLQLAVQNVAARDFLEAQQAYTAALSSIARQHVNYITDRIELFFDLEAFDVNECGYWQGVSGDFGPQMNTDFPNTNPRPYDVLPPRVRYSPTVREMESIPPGEAVVR